MRDTRLWVRMENKKKIIVGQYYPALDGVRGLAAILVLWLHASTFALEANHVIQPGSFAHGYFMLSLFGQTGVQLFFVLSGFLITGILIDTSENEGVLKSFYIRRSLRIFPLYYAVIFLVALIGLLVSGPSALNDELLMYIFYIQNWSSKFSEDSYVWLNHSWTLAVEEQFYIFWPVVFLAFYKRSVADVIALCLFMVLVSWGIRNAVPLQSSKLVFTSTLSVMDGLSLGALLSVVCVHYRTQLGNVHKNFKYIFFLFLIYLCFSVAFYTSINQFQSDMARWGLCFFNVFYMCLIGYLYLSDEENVIKSSFQSQSLIRLGKVSYGVYLFHAPIMLLMAKFLSAYKLSFLVNHGLILFIGGGVSFFLAVLSYKFFEKPIINLKHKWAPANSA